MTAESTFKLGPILSRTLGQKTNRGPIQSKLFYGFLFLLLFTMLIPREHLAWGQISSLVPSKTRNRPSEAKIKQTLKHTKNVKESQIAINNKWMHYCTRVHHKIQLLQSFQSLRDNSKSNYCKSNMLPKIINMFAVSPLCTNPAQGKSFRRTDLMMPLLFV